MTEGRDWMVWSLDEYQVRIWWGQIPVPYYHAGNNVGTLGGRSNESDSLATIRTLR